MCVRAMVDVSDRNGLSSYLPLPLVIGRRWRGQAQEQEEDEAEAKIDRK